MSGSAGVNGEELPPVTRRVSQEQITLYADVSGDRNPLHVDPGFARSVGLDGTIAHGLLEMAILGDAIAQWAGDGAALEELSCRFSRPLRAGDTITCTGRETGTEGDRRVLEVGAVSGRGERVLTHGRATIRPSR